MYSVVFITCFFFFKQKTAYEMRISDWSSDVCSSDLSRRTNRSAERPISIKRPSGSAIGSSSARTPSGRARSRQRTALHLSDSRRFWKAAACRCCKWEKMRSCCDIRSEEHTSELQSLMRISYAVFCLKKKNKYGNEQNKTTIT